MIIKATAECEWCGAIIDIPKKKTTRAFMIAFNKLKRHHDWGCENQGKAKQAVEKSKTATDSIIKEIMN